MKLSSLLIATSLIAGCALGMNDSSDDNSNDFSEDSPTLGVPLGHPGITPTIANAAPSATDPILYHGGSVMTSAHNTVYLIWYGTWNANAQTIIADWAKTIGASQYFAINTTYHNKAGAFVDAAIHFGGQITDNYSQGMTIDDTGVQTIVSNAIASKQLPLNSNGIYFVLGATDVTESSGMCSQYCGWHYFGSISGKNIKYAYIGNPDQCPSACEAQGSSSPNGDTGADGAISIMSHELEETVTDPYVSAWYDASGEENGDKCAWTFGTEQTASNGSLWNVQVGAREFLIQQDWNAST